MATGSADAWETKFALSCGVDNTQILGNILYFASTAGTKSSVVQGASVQEARLSGVTESCDCASICDAHARLVPAEGGCRTWKHSGSTCVLQGSAFEDGKGLYGLPSKGGFNAELSSAH